MSYVGPPVAGDEIATLLGSLERERATFAWKCADLDSAGLRATVGSSAITLGGLLKHLALVEDHYFSGKLHGLEPAPPWKAVDFDADPDWEWRTAAEDTPEQLYTLWRDTVARSARWWRRRWPTAGWTSCAGALGRTGARPACAAC